MGGGYFPYFSENRPQKHKKHAILREVCKIACFLCFWRFCILHAPTPPPLATLLLTPLMSTVVLQSDSIYWKMKNETNIITMHNFLFLLQQDLRFIHLFWKQPISITYSMLSAVKKNSLISSKFHIGLLCTFRTKTKQYFSTNQIVKMTNFDQSKYDEKFSIFQKLHSRFGT